VISVIGKVIIIRNGLTKAFNKPIIKAEIISEEGDEKLINGVI